MASSRSLVEFEPGAYVVFGALIYTPQNPLLVCTVVESAVVSGQVRNHFPPFPFPLPLPYEEGGIC